MFRASRAHLQEDIVVYKQHMVPSLSIRVLVACRYTASVRTDCGGKFVVGRASLYKTWDSTFKISHFQCFLSNWVNEQRNILHEIRKQKANWIGHILRRNCLLKHVIEGKIKGEMEVARRRGRRRKKLLDDLKDRRGYSHLKEEALDRTMWRNRFGGGFGPVVRQITGWWWWRF